MITIQLKIHMYHFVLGQTNDIYIWKYIIAILIYTSRQNVTTSNNISWSVDLGSTAVLSQFEANKNIFGGWQVSKDLDFRLLEKWDFSVLWNIFGYFVALLNSAGVSRETHISSQEKVSWHTTPWHSDRVICGGGVAVAQDPIRLYSVLGGRVQGGAKEASSARPCLWGESVALEECVFSDSSWNNVVARILATIVVNPAVITRTMTTIRAMIPPTIKRKHGKPAAPII